MQAITTRYIGPTLTKGPRIIARCDAGSITIPFDHSSDCAHTEAARQLVIKISGYGTTDNPRKDWLGRWVRGSLSGNAEDYVFVQVSDDGEYFSFCQ